VVQCWVPSWLQSKGPGDDLGVRIDGSIFVHIAGGAVHLSIVWSNLCGGSLFLQVEILCA
jgi:hypothetical protein